MKKSRTCIALIKTRTGKLIMAGDRRVTYGDAEMYSVSAVPKINKRNAFLIGYTGNPAICEALIHLTKIPNYIPHPLNKYIMCELEENIKKLLLKRGYEDNGSIILTEKDGSALLLGIDGRAFVIDIDPILEEGRVWGKAVVESGEVLLPWSIGCGSDSALPILLAEKKEKGYNTREGLKKAMEIAAEISPGCDNNIDYIEV